MNVTTTQWILEFIGSTPVTFGAVLSTKQSWQHRIDYSRTQTHAYTYLEGNLGWLASRQAAGRQASKQAAFLFRGRRSWSRRLSFLPPLRLLFSPSSPFPSRPRSLNHTLLLLLSLSLLLVCGARTVESFSLPLRWSFSTVTPSPPNLERVGRVH